MLWFTPFRLDPITQTLWHDDQQVHIRAKTFLVLRYLLENAPRVVTRDELFAALWARTTVGEGLLRGYIRELRQLLGDDAQTPRYIETLAGRGYRFVAEVSSGPAASSRGIGDSGSFPVLPSLQRGEVPGAIGRDREIAALEEWLGPSAPRAAALVLVTGEAGSGRTTVVDAALDRICSSSSAIVVHGHCIQNHGSVEPYLPVLDALQRLCRGPDGRWIVETLSRFAPMWLLEMTGVIPETEVEALQRRMKGATRERMARELAEALDALSRERPVVLIVEDLQWSDVATVDLVSFLVRRREPARFKVLGTCRVADVLGAGHPLRWTLAELKAHGRCLELALGPLDADAVTAYVAARFPVNAFPPELAAAVHRNTDGNPLFVVALLDALVDDRSLVEVDGEWRHRLTVEEIASRTPERLVHLIEGTIDRLTDAERRVLEASSVVGAEFTTAMVAAALEMSVHDVEDACELLHRDRRLLKRSGVGSWPDGTRESRYAVVHAIHQRVALHRVPPARRELWHRRIAEALERGFGERAFEIAPELANHFERSGDVVRAVRYRTLALTLASAGDHGRSASGGRHPRMSSRPPPPSTFPERRPRETDVSGSTYLG